MPIVHRTNLMVREELERLLSESVTEACHRIDTAFSELPLPAIAIALTLMIRECPELARAFEITHAQPPGHPFTLEQLQGMGLGDIEVIHRKVGDA